MTSKPSSTEQVFKGTPEQINKEVSDAINNAMAAGDVMTAGAIIGSVTAGATADRVAAQIMRLPGATMGALGSGALSYVVTAVLAFAQTPNISGRDRYQFAHEVMTQAAAIIAEKLAQQQDDTGALH